MSDTPRTDAEYNKCGEAGMVRADFAEGLERELAEAKHQLHAQEDDSLNRVTKLIRERDEMRACLEWFVHEDRGFGADEALLRFRGLMIGDPPVEYHIHTSNSPHLWTRSFLSAPGATCYVCHLQAHVFIVGAGAHYCEKHEGITQQRLIERLRKVADFGSDNGIPYLNQLVKSGLEGA